MEENNSFIPLLIVITLAFVVPLLLDRVKRISIPIVVGEIIAGILVGKSGFGWVKEDEVLLVLLAEFGFVFLMFLSGMEIDFSSLGSFNRRNPKKNDKAPPKSGNPVGLGAVFFLLTLLLSTIVGALLMLGGWTKDPWMMALILSTTSLGVVLPVLKQSRLSTGRYGQALLIAALIADFTTMLLITVYVSIISLGITLDILLVILLFVVFILFYRLGMVVFKENSYIRRAINQVSHATSQIKVRAAFAIMLGFVALSELLGTEIILGAFLAGVVIALLRIPEDEDLSPQLEAIGFGFFIPIFFIMVGVSFNLQSLLDSPQNLLLVPILIIAAFAVKIIPSGLFKRLFTWRESLAGGILLSARLSLIIAASAIGLRLGIIDESLNSAIILVAIITVIVAPLLFMKLQPPQPVSIEQYVVVAGAGITGIQVASKLKAHNEIVLVVDPREKNVVQAKNAGLNAILDALDHPSKELEQKLDNAKALVCTHNNIERNYTICQIARTHYGIDNVVARVSDPGEISRFERLGVKTVNAAIDSPSLLVMLTRSPALYELMTRTDDNNKVFELSVSNPKCYGKALRDLNLPCGLLVLAVRRNGELIVPDGNTVIEAGDHVSLLGTIECMEEAREVFS
jgi:Kef-type K+ transport system membrane component KefB/Trk K+ transport system NAD-binding subunit